jgi:hypothetical protein
LYFGCLIAQISGWWFLTHWFFYAGFYCTHSGNCKLTEFFGNVFGRAVSYVYKDNMHDSDFNCGVDLVVTCKFHDPKDINPDLLCHPPTAYADDSEQNSDADIDMFYTSDIKEPTDTNHSSLDSDIEMPDDYVYDIDRDQCQCLKENENGRLFNTQHLLTFGIHSQCVIK